MIRALDRRCFLTTSAGLIAGGLTSSLFAQSPPPVTNPRATDGDSRAEPDWSEKFVLTVGTKQGDLIGRDDRVLQAAVDYVKRMGGGT
ncbi:MAG: hypothetical protein HUJ26_22245, partial [Planctomycetaceae bacterium]|nr:hypothetical protein [Planctomycetaceae bacterium]